MANIAASNFELASCQTSIFTPEIAFSTSKALTQFYPQHSAFFDASPTVLPVPDDAPQEIPRIILQTSSHEWTCQISPVRTDVTWRRTKSRVGEVQIAGLFQVAEKVLLDYSSALKPRIGRMAGVIARFCGHETPGLFLARHFCKDEWIAAPLNRPENFELHAHKKFRLAGRFDVNSWVRNKTGLLSEDAKAKPVVLVEQDINTLAEIESDTSFGSEDIKGFLVAVAAEADVILRLYYPEDRKK